MRAVEAQLVEVGNAPPRTAHDLLWTFARIRGDMLERPLLMPTGNARAKADAFLDQLGGNEKAYADIEPSIRLFFAEARDGPEPRLLDVGFGFGAWMHRFPDLRERMYLPQRPPPKSARSAAFDRAMNGEG